MSRRSVFSPIVSSLAAILILASGCSDQVPTAVELGTGYQPVALPAAEIAPSFSLSGDAARVIGPEGGEISVGRITIRFPEGAVAEPTRISVKPDLKNLAVTFGPHGLQFPRGNEPTVTFSYKGIADLPERHLTVFYLGGAGEALERLTVSVDTRAKEVSAALRHFSLYALAMP